MSALDIEPATNHNGVASPEALAGSELDVPARIKEILAAVKPLAAEYYRLTGKPLGVTGEVAEYVAAELLGLKLVPPRTAGYDALRHTLAGAQRIQIKGRAYDPGAQSSQRIGTIKRDGPCDIVMLVLLDNATLDPVEIWEVPFAGVVARLIEPGSKARNERGALSVSDFKRLGRRVWSVTGGREQVLYFAYGSNMDPEQMRERCPDAELVGIGVLADHALCFPRRSKNRNCGVSSVAPVAGRETWGVVFHLTPQDLAALDVSEGFRSDRDASLNSYNRVPVIVSVDDAPTEMMTYVAVDQEAPPLPNAAYLKHIRDGARHHGLPVAYLEYLDSIEHG
ncbi:gamma-glutamylcyclotransferase [Pseudaminobacter arsenicus]|uniref:Gamma-glutamylcyclotransferase n=1 Tax=Borborobacter arsenicus TaxID=1851146 RepID=A0A432V3V3_9HYPH|nr:gamma-glutamylcyclotransferase family protein [Pseudaminobacter arsenicus]RUM96790.1 gamma-glutamylcyclotransferase [Pseudaminobacter arsenicus]